MVIERNKDQIIIKISDSIKDRDLKALTDYVSYIEAIANSHANRIRLMKSPRKLTALGGKLIKTVSSLHDHRIMFVSPDEIDAAIWQQASTMS